MVIKIINFSVFKNNLSFNDLDKEVLMFDSEWLHWIQFEFNILPPAG